MTASDNLTERLPIVDTEGRVTGSATRGKCHGGNMWLHPVVYLHVFDMHGRIYLQKRPDWKEIQPGKWDTAVGGHVDYGEDIVSALRREAREELGLTDICPEFVTRYIFESDRERELVYAYRVTTDLTPRPTEELAGGRFWTFAEIEDAIATGNILTPNFIEEYRRLFAPD